MIRTCSAVLFLLILGTPSALGAEPASPDPKSLIVSPEDLEKAHELVQQLGHEEFDERERAEAELARMGRLAYEPLLEGANSDPSPEVRFRCRSLLPMAAARELEARIDVFLADVSGKYEHDLPGWKEFQALARDEWTLFGYRIWGETGNDRVAREMFAEMVGSPANRKLLSALDDPSLSIAQEAGNRRDELYYMYYPQRIRIGGVTQPQPPKQPPSLADMTTLLFVESLAGSRYVPPRRSMSSLFSASKFTTEVREDNPKGHLLKKVAAVWFDTRRDPYDLYYAMNLSSSFGLDDQGLRIALRLFESKNATVYYRGNAAALIVRMGNKSHIARLEESFNDKAVIYNSRRTQVINGQRRIMVIEIQLRDVAIAAALKLLGEDPENYGFVNLRKGNSSFTYSQYYFPSFGWVYDADEMREWAIERMNEKRDK